MNPPADPAPPAVLLLGATGRTGARVLGELLGRGLEVRVVVRAAARLPAECAGHPRLRVVEADPLTLADAELRSLLTGCGAAVSCLGHRISLRGLFGPPRDLVARAVLRLCRGIEALRPAAPVKLVVLTSVSVNAPGRREARRGGGERALLALLRGLLPPVRDNQRTADLLARQIGPAHPFLRWAVLRPDTLVDGERSAYRLHPELVDRLAAPGRTTLANLAHGMGELVTDEAAWATWQGSFPVLVDAASPGTD